MAAEEGPEGVARAAAKTGWAAAVRGAVVKVVVSVVVAMVAVERGWAAEARVEAEKGWAVREVKVVLVEAAVEAAVR